MWQTTGLVLVAVGAFILAGVIVSWLSAVGALTFVVGVELIVVGVALERRGLRSIVGDGEGGSGAC